MEVLILMVFVSLMLVVLAMGFYAWTLRQRTYEHSERLSLLPLEQRGTDPWNE